jgi:hypothetical protein
MICQWLIMFLAACFQFLSFMRRQADCRGSPVFFAIFLWSTSQLGLIRPEAMGYFLFNLCYRSLCPEMYRNFTVLAARKKPKKAVFLDIGTFWSNQVGALLSSL